jgi:hypothetical protein
MALSPTQVDLLVFTHPLATPQVSVFCPRLDLEVAWAGGTDQHTPSSPSPLAHEKRAGGGQRNGAQHSGATQGVQGGGNEWTDAAPHAATHHPDYDPSTSQCFCVEYAPPDNDPRWLRYPYVNNVHYYADPAVSHHLIHHYVLAMKTDADVFLSPAFLHWKPDRHEGWWGPGHLASGLGSEERSARWI